MAIAHNGNMSNGAMLPMRDTFTGKKYKTVWAEKRSGWEPLYEITQIKGDGETHPFLSPNDEFADYETWTNTIGAPELITVWTDPEFNPDLLASYYARVLEIPTPRWTAYEAKRFGITMKKEIPMIDVERACTSPIWYTP